MSDSPARGREPGLLARGRRHGVASHGRRCARRRLAAGAAAALAAAVLGGCVSLPSNGQVRVTGQQGSAGSVPPQLVPVPPGGDWKPIQIVEGFLAASGSSLSGNSLDGNSLSGASFEVAREYLSPTYRIAWRPGRSATVIEQQPSITESAAVPTTHITGGASSSQVIVSSRFVETLQSAGNMVVSSASHAFQFELIQVDGQWRINAISADGKLTPTLLLLTDTDFVRDYQPRNLYFFPAGSQADVLVPDPVFIPQQAGTDGGAQLLVQGLLGSPTPAAGPAGWLNGATATAFPPGTKKSDVSVQVSGIKAIVNLTGAAAAVGPQRLVRMEAQLVWTLTYSPYPSGAGTVPAPTGIGSVELLLNHRRQVLLLPQRFQRFFAGWTSQGANAPFYFQSAGEGGKPQVDVRRAGGSAPVPVPLPGEVGSGTFTAIAVSPGAPAQAMLAACRGREVYLIPVRPSATGVASQRLPAGCTSLSWDGGGDLWATAGNVVYVLPSGTPSGIAKPQVQAFSAILTRSSPTKSGVTLSSLHMAPDGVRLAMIARTAAGAQIVVAAVSRSVAQIYPVQSYQTVRVGSDITDPITLSWDGPDDLLVVGQSRDVSQQLYKVPLNGGASVRLPTVLPPHVTSLAASLASLAASLPAVVVSTGTAQQGGGQIRVLRPRSSGMWSRIAAGGTPAYPGPG